MYCKNCGEPINENQAVCLKCGVAKGFGKSYCSNCGNAVGAEAAFCVNCGVALKTGNGANGFTPHTEGLKERSLITAILLSVLTCGIYSIYWFIKLTDEMNQASQKNETSGVIAFILNLVTCGIYGIYWAYKLGEKRDVVANENSSCGLIYLALTIFGFGIVVYILAQDTLNKAIAANKY